MLHAQMRVSQEDGPFLFSLWPDLSRWEGGEEMKPRKREGEKEKMMTVIITIKDITIINK